MQYKVPQNVDIEDKVIGPLTIRQFIIILFAVGIIIVLNFLLVGPLRLIFFLLAAIIAAASLSLAFFKYGDQNLEVFIISAWKTIMSPRKRVWKKEAYKPESNKQPTKPAPAPKPEEKRVEIQKAREGLSELARLVDSGGYSALPKEHRGNFEPKKQANVTAPDLLEKVEKPNQEVDDYITTAAKTVPKREQLVSEAASIKPGKAAGETPKIRLREDEFAG